MDEEEKMINELGEITPVAASSTAEPKTPEVNEESVQPEKTEKSTEEAKTEGKQVKGAEKRIHDLVDERDQYKQKVEDLSSKLAEYTAGTQVPGEYPTYQPANGASQGEERELTIDDLRAIARIEVEKERTVNRINAEATETQKLYPSLDQTSDQFDPDINEAVTTAVWLEIQKDPSKSVKKLTERYMKPYLKAAERAVGDEKATLAKQVSETALRPSTIKGTDKKAADKSIEELEAELGIVH